MRIITGSLRGRRITLPANLPVRPTTDIAKEGLFNILNNKIDFERSVVLDLFSGTGNISFEFISRGAHSVTAIEENSKCVSFIKSVSEKLAITNLHVLRNDVLSYLKRAHTSFDVIFADPPYDFKELNLIPQLLFENQFLEKEGLFILEHSKAHSFANHPFFIEERQYGKVHFSFFSSKEKI